MESEKQHTKNSTARGRKAKSPATKNAAAKKAAPKAPRKAAVKPASTRARKAVPKAAAPQATAAPSAAPTASTARRGFTAEERYRMIEEAAYYRAQRRGFAPGHQDRDWKDAEAEIDAMLLRQERTRDE